MIGLGIMCAMVAVGVVIWAVVPRSGSGGGWLSSRSSTELPFVGAWEQKADGSARGIITFDADGRFTETGFHNDTQTEMKGTWRVADNKLMLKGDSVKVSIDGDDATAGSDGVWVEVALEIVALGDNKILLKSKSGRRTIEFTRYGR